MSYVGEQHAITNQMVFSQYLKWNTALWVKQCNYKRKQFLKVKNYYVLIFERKQLNSFLKGEKLPIFCHKYFFNRKFDKFGHFRPKNLKGWSDKLETLHVETLGTILKKPRKQKNYPGSPSLWNWNLKYTNILQYFWQHGSVVKYLSCGF